MENNNQSKLEKNRRARRDGKEKAWIVDKEKLEKIPKPNDYKGQIYLITCSENNKKYVGQARNYMINRGKYVKHGYDSRFRQHISEAINNTKAKQCDALNNSIRKYGREKFKVELLEECSVDVINVREEYYVKKYNTLAPNGYNLTTGGKQMEISEEAKVKISDTLKDYFSGEGVKEKHSQSQKDKNDRVKLEKYKGKNISKIEAYEYDNPEYNLVRLHVNYVDNGIMLRVRTDFKDKYEDMDNVAKRAMKFALKLVNNDYEKIIVSPYLDEFLYS